MQLDSFCRNDSSVVYKTKKNRKWLEGKRSWCYNTTIATANYVCRKWSTAPLSFSVKYGNVAMLYYSMDLEYYSTFNFHDKKKKGKGNFLDLSLKTGKKIDEIKDN